MKLQYKRNKGFSLLELILAIGIISVLTAVIYIGGNSMMAKSMAKKELYQLDTLKSNIDKASLLVSSDPALGIGTLQDIVTSSNLISSGMVSKSENDGTNIVNVFKTGNVNVRAVSLTLSNPVVSTLTAYTITVQNVPQKSCIYMLQDYTSRDWMEISVNGNLVKSNTMDFTPTVAASACNSEDMSTLEYTQTMNERGEFAPLNLPANTGVSHPGKYVRVFDAKFRPTIGSGTGVAATCTGGSVNTIDGNYCSCPAGTILFGDRCEAIGTPGVCLPGEGWSIANHACLDLPNPPTKPLAQVKGVYENGTYIPAFLAGQTQAQSYHSVLSCNGMKRSTNTSVNWQEPINLMEQTSGTTTTVVPADRYEDLTGVVCGVCEWGQKIDAQGRCSAFVDLN